MNSREIVRPSTAPSTEPAASGVSRRSLVAGAAAGVAVVAAGQPAWATDSFRPGARRAPGLRPGDRKVVSAIRPQRELRDLRALSEDIGPRIGGTPSERAAADHIAAELDRQRLAVRLEPFPVADKFLADIGDPGGQLDDDICWQAGASPDAAHGVRVAGPALDVRSADAPSWPTDAAAVQGAVVLADDNQNADAAARVVARAAFVAEAQRRGAAAVLLLPLDGVFPRRASASSPRLVPTPSGSTPPPPTPTASIPVVGVAQVQKRLLREDLAVRRLQLQVATTAHRGLTSHNVIGERPGARRGLSPLVYVGAHYDTVIGAPGANDDGSGTVLTLELARVFRTIGATEAAIRFALWGSEEQGLIGSRYHVAQLPQPERDRIRGAFNNDMVGTSWAPATRYWLLSFDGKANATTETVAAAATRLGYSPQLSEVTTRGSSDHQSFQEVGIASANFSWRGEASPALLEPPYHSPEDTIARNISVDRLTVSTELIGCAAHDLASRR